MTTRSSAATEVRRRKDDSDDEKPRSRDAPVPRDDEDEDDVAARRPAQGQGSGRRGRLRRWPAPRQGPRRGQRRLQEPHQGPGRQRRLQEPRQEPRRRQRRLGRRSGKSRADESDVWGEKSKAKSRADKSREAPARPSTCRGPRAGPGTTTATRGAATSLGRATSRAPEPGRRERRLGRPEEPRARRRRRRLQVEAKTTTWRVRDVDDDGNTTITSARSPRVIEEARRRHREAVRDGGASPVPFSTTRPPDDVAEAFDRLKTENAALRHELAQSLKAADVLAAGGVAAATMAQSLADGDAPGRAWTWCLVRRPGRGASYPHFSGGPVVIGAAAPVCAVSAGGPWCRSAAPALVCGARTSGPSARPSKIGLRGRSPSTACRACGPP